jgi:GNAT superfamily N-acetyltransferase
VIGEQIQMSPAQISRNIKDLVEEGMVDVDLSYSQRLRVLRLTYTGQLQAQELVAARKAAFAAAIDAIAPEDRPLVLGMARFQRVAGSESERPTMSALEPKHAVYLYNWILASLPAKLTNQPQFLAFASRTLSDALTRWPVFNDCAGLALRDADGNIVGACAIIADPTASSATLVGPFVDPSYRRAGLATQMLRECRSICRKQNLAELTTCIPIQDCNIGGFLRTEGFAVDRNANGISGFGGGAWEMLKHGI